MRCLGKPNMYGFFSQWMILPFHSSSNVEKMSSFGLLRPKKEVGRQGQFQLCAKMALESFQLCEEDLLIESLTSS